jgi:hypothetical protein
MAPDEKTPICGEIISPRRFATAAPPRLFLSVTIRGKK